jgi:hypothetical protein
MRTARVWIAAAGISVAALSVAAAQDQRQDQMSPSRGPAGAEKAQQQEMRGQQPEMRQGQSEKRQTESQASESAPKGEAVQSQEREPRKGEAAQGQEREPRKGEAAQGQEREPRKGEAAQGETQKPRDMGAAQNERPDANRKTGEAEKNGAGQRTGDAMRRGESRKPEGANAATGANRDTTRTGETMQGGGERRTNEAATGGQRFSANRVHAVGGARIPQDKAAQIANDLSATAQPRHLDVRVNVGMPLPGDVDIEPLPPSIVELMPEYRGYDYVYANDEVVIIDPSSRRVVEMISEGAGTAMNEGGEAVAGATRVNPCGP